MRSQVWLGYIVATDRVALMNKFQVFGCTDKPLQVLYSIIGVAGSLILGVAYIAGSFRFLFHLHLNPSQVITQISHSLKTSYRLGFMSRQLYVMT